MVLPYLKKIIYNKLTMGIVTGLLVIGIAFTVFFTSMGQENTLVQDQSELELQGLAIDNDSNVTANEKEANLSPNHITANSQTSLNIENITTLNNHLAEDKMNRQEAMASENRKEQLDEKSREEIAIYKFIKAKRKKVPDYEAELIAKCIVEFGSEYNIDPLFVAALIDRESGFNARAVSRSGAKGLGQIMPFNFKGVGITDPFNIEQSVKGTVRYLAYLFKRWENKPNRKSVVLASYLEGPNAIMRKNFTWKKTSQKYIDDIFLNWEQLKKLG